MTTPATYPGVVVVPTIQPLSYAGLDYLRSFGVLHTPDFMYPHPAFDRYRESYPRRSELHQNCYSRAGDEQSAAPAGV